jgi:VCBS repeat-containing protein
MNFRKLSGLHSRKERRQGLRQQLRLEHLESRRVFAGLAPVAVNDVYTAVADQTLEVAASGVLANDTDAEGDALSALQFQGPNNGTLEMGPDGSFAYTPNPGFVGTDGFLYQADDGTSKSHMAAVTIVVASPNSAPAGENDAYSVSEDDVLGIGSSNGVLANDNDVDGDPLTAQLVDGPLNGLLELNPDGSFRYTPTENFYGTDTFSYQASDGTTTSDLVTVEITVTAANDVPLAANDQYTTNEDEPLVVDALGVLANDTDIDGDPLTAELISGPQHGTLEMNADGSFSYVPDENFNGTDAFSYQASDGTSLSDLVAVEITVSAVNDAPVATNDQYATDEDQPLVVDAAAGVLANDSDVDGDPLIAQLVDGPQNGLLELNPDGSFSYSPGENFNGTDAFTYQASDGSSKSDLVVVEISIAAVNDAPIASNDQYATDEDQPLVVDVAAGVLANDSDADGDPLLASLVDGPQHGLLELNADGSFSYTPEENFNGIDTFTYQVSDGGLVSELAVVEIAVAAVNDAPMGTNDQYATNENEALIVASPGVLENDSDIDGDPLTAQLVDGPQNGTLELNPDGSFSYVPNENFNGIDTFTYQASDGSVESELVVVEISIAAVNSPPTTGDDSYFTRVDQPLVVNAPGVLGNDSDLDGDLLTVQIADGPTHGSVELAADGSFVYVPEAGYIGEDQFTYLASDGVESTLATVSLEVRSENVQPIAVNDVYKVEADAELIVDAATGVLRNDTDANGDPLEAILFRGPKYGEFTLNADGSFNYKPNEGFSGMDSFLYRVSDGELSSLLAVVTLYVQPSNGTETGTLPAFATSEVGNFPADGVMAADEPRTEMPVRDIILGMMDLGEMLLAQNDCLLAGR